MPLKRTKGRLRVVSTPQRAQEGRRRPVSPVTRPRLPAAKDADALVMLLAEGLAEVAQLSEVERAKPGDGPTAARRRAEKRVRELRARLGARVGKGVVRELTSALTADGGLFLRAAAACTTSERRAYALRSVVDAVAIGREHGIGSTSGLVLLARAARWGALSNILLDAALRGAMTVERLKLASLCGSAARLDTLAALQLGKQADDNRRAVLPMLTSDDLRARELEMQRRHEAEARARGLVVEESDAADEPKERTP